MKYSALFAFLVLMATAAQTTNQANAFWKPNPRNYNVKQPGLHLYLGTDKSTDCGDMQYYIPNADVSPVIRLGLRLWKKY